MTMSSYDQQNPNNVRLPSFTELTSNFNKTLNINNGQGATTGPDVPKSSNGDLSHGSSTSIKSLSTYQHDETAGTKQEEQYSLPPNSSSHMMPRHFSHQPTNSASAASIHPINTNYDGPNYQHTSTQMSPYSTLVTPTSSHFDPQYTVSSNYEKELRERRMSLQIPPYEHRQKKDSYDSETSLSQLADIASTAFEERELPQPPQLIVEMNDTLHDFVKLHQIVHDINEDFQFHIRNSQDADPNTMMYIEGREHIGITVENFNKFIDKIPMAALVDSINITKKLQRFFRQWEQIRQLTEMRDLRIQEDNRRKEEDLRRKRVEEAEHQKFTKKHKSTSSKQSVSSSSSDGDTPTSNSADSTFSQDLKGGVFNEDLSIKQDHACQQCGSNDTPEWRRGPYGSRSLCNACGLFYGKLIKKFGFDQAAEIMLKRKKDGNGEDRRIPILD